jgi:hypothetical protein
MARAVRQHSAERAVWPHPVEIDAEFRFGLQAVQLHRDIERLAGRDFFGCREGAPIRISHVIGDDSPFGQPKSRDNQNQTKKTRHTVQD